MTTIAFVFARGGSRGVKRKNLRLLAGRPLLAHAIEAAQAVPAISRVVVSTEDGEIAETARRYGAEVLARPAELAADDSPEWLSWQHAVRWMGEWLGIGERELSSADVSRGTPRVTVPVLMKERMDRFVSVPCTAPLRLPADIEATLAALDRGTDGVLCVTPARRNPFYNQVVLDAGGHARVVIGYGAIHNRQAAPELYDVTTVCYAAWPAFILRAGSMLEGRIRAVVVPEERAVDIDTELDLRVAEVLMEERERREVA